MERIAGESDDKLRPAVRHLLHQKRTIKGIYRNVTEAHVARLERVYDRLTPPDPILRVGVSLPRVRGQ